jgi:hypothetical protein
VAQSNEQHTRIVPVLEGSFEILDSKRWILTNKADHCVIVRDAYFEFHWVARLEIEFHRTKNRTLEKLEGAAPETIQTPGSLRPINRAARS